MNFKSIAFLVLFLVWLGLCSWWKLKDTFSFNQSVDAPVLDTLAQNISVDTLQNSATNVFDSTATLDSATVDVPVFPSQLEMVSGKMLIHYKDKNAKILSDSNIVKYINNYLLSYKKDSVLQIVAHTNDLGSGQNNWDLTVQIVRDIKYFLIFKGIPVDKIHIEGRGETEKIIHDTTEVARYTNNRIEISKK